MQNFADQVASESTATPASELDSGASNASGGNGANGLTQQDDDSPETQHGTGETNGVPPTTAPSTDDRKVPLRALEDEREKRQYERQLREAQERRLAELEARIASTTTPKTDEQPEIDYDGIWENPRAVFEAHEQVRGKQSRAQVMEASREMARAHFTDYDQTIERLSDMQVPGLEEAVAKSPTPAFTAYRMIKEHERTQASRVDASEVKNLQDALEQAKQELAAMRGEVTRPPVSLSQSRSGSGGARQSAPTQEDILSAAWDRPLRARK